MVTHIIFDTYCFHTVTTVTRTHLNFTLYLHCLSCFVNCRKGIRLPNEFVLMYFSHRGPGSVVGIATGYGLDGPGFESRWGEIFRTSPDRPWGPPSLLHKEYRVFPWGKARPGCNAEPSPLLVPRSWKSRAIPLFLLWAVRPVKSLSACTRA